MQILVCPICGGIVKTDSASSIALCDYCGSKFAIPKNYEQKSKLFNCAISYRRANEFDKAISVYEDILKEDYYDAEAHWGLVLSKFGIEYVFDPSTGKYIPTCHRTQPFSILVDHDYRAAIKYADHETCQNYEIEAARIEKIQSDFLEISRKEPPYDVFICYKDSDDNGNRTEDSVIAQEIYDELIKMDWNVFFARKTLEDKLGQQYEPYIYAALTSALVMVVVGTTQENINSVWVKNEWNRFLEMGRDSPKVLIPVYKGITPDELPENFSMLQAQDMSQIGAIKILIRTIDNYLRGEEKEKTSDNSSIFPDESVASLERLEKNGETFLMLKEFTEAEKVYNSITQNYPEDYRGWWGLIVCKTKDFSIIDTDQNILDAEFGYIRKLTTEEIYQDCASKFKKYIMEVSRKRAEEDIADINNIIDGHQNELRKMEHIISHFEYLKSEEEEEIQKIEKNAAKEKQYCEEKIEDVYKEEKKCIRRLIFFILILLIGSLIMINVKFLIGLIIAFVGFYGTFLTSVSMFANNNEWKIELKKQESIIKEKSDEVIEARRKTEYLNTKYAPHFKILKEEDEKTRKKIDECNQYLNMGINQISMYWFLRRCNSIGIQQPVDSRVDDLRFRICSNDDELIEIKCIHCGRTNRLSKVTYFDLDCRCQYCETKIF